MAIQREGGNQRLGYNLIMAEPLFTPRSGIGARYVDPSTKKEYVFTNSGWKPMAVDIKSDVVDNNTFEVKPEEKDLETKLLQGGATREIAMRAITEKRRIAANRKMTDPLNDRTQNDQTNTEILNNKPTSKFEGKTKQQVLKQAFNDGVTDTGELKKIGDMYDMFSEPEADISVIKELVTQRKELADAGFNTQVIDSKLESMGFAKSTEGADVIATGEAAKFAPAVSRALAQMEEASGIGTDESIFTGGGTSATKILTGVRNFGRKAVDAEFSQKTERYKNMVELAIGSMNKMMGAGTLNEGEALRLLENVPNDNTSENVARAWMNDVRKVFGVDMNKVDKGIYANAGSTLGDNNQDDTTGNPFYNAKDLGTAVSGAGESLAKRGQAIMNTLERGNRGEMSAPRGMLRVAGEVAGAVGDLGFEVLGLLSPKFVDDIASSAAGEVAGTEVVQAAASKYQDFKTAYPEASKDLEAVFNIASLLPMERVAEAGIKGVAKLGGRAVRIGGKTIERIPLLNKVAGSVDELITNADNAVAAGTVSDVASEAVAGAKGTAAKRAAAETTSLKPSIKEKWAGLSADIKTRIAGKQEQLQEYFDVAHTRNLQDTAPTPLEYGALKVNEAAKQMETLINDTGSQIGAFRKKVGSIQATPEQIADIENVFKQQLEKLNLTVNKGKIQQMAGTVSKTGAKGDISMLQDLWNDFVTVKQGRNLERLIDLRSSFDRKINYGKTAMEVSNSVDPVSRSVRTKIADVAAGMVGKTEAQRLKQYSEFMDAYDMITDYSSKKTGSEFLLKQALSERGRAPREVMEAIKQFTGIDLMDDAVMATLATDLIGNTKQQGLLRQEILKAGLDAGSVLKGDPRGLLGLLDTVVKKKLLDEEKIYLNAAKTKK